MFALKSNKCFLKLTLISSCLLVTTLSGCSSLGIGEDEFACPGRPDGVKCTSAWGVYESTHNGNVPKSNIENSDEEHSGEQGGITANDPQQQDFIIDNYVAPRLPDKSVPVRTQLRLCAYG